MDTHAVTDLLLKMSDGKEDVVDELPRWSTKSSSVSRQAISDENAPPHSSANRSRERSLYTRMAGGLTPTKPPRSSASQPSRSSGIEKPWLHEQLTKWQGRRPARAVAVGLSSSQYQLFARRGECPFHRNRRPTIRADPRPLSHDFLLV